MNVNINGKEQSVPDGSFLSQLLEQHQLDSQSVAIELNRKVIDRKLYPSTRLAENDVVEIVRFVGGG